MGAYYRMVTLTFRHLNTETDVVEEDLHLGDMRMWLVAGSTFCN